MFLIPFIFLFLAVTAILTFHLRTSRPRTDRVTVALLALWLAFGTILISATVLAQRLFPD